MCPDTTFKNTDEALNGLAHAFATPTHHKLHHLVAREDLSPWRNVHRAPVPVFTLFSILRAAGEGGASPTLATLHQLTEAEAVLHQCALPTLWPYIG